ncbi:MAG: NUDIX hydrolase N-terminal domain-containing protein [Oscillospiraceae bacterium]|nr:NUDIX hydrolase N-terminal domain-containing protein [Oscillospiraceae bacterium]
MDSNQVNSNRIIELAHELQALAAAGLTYTNTAFDTERYERIRDIAAEITSAVSEEPLEKVKRIFEANADYQTPKISTRAAIFNEKEEVLLVKDFDGKWVLPGGWCDYDQTIMSNTVKEVLEEAGLVVEPYRLVGIFDNQKRSKPQSYFHAENVHVLCRVISGEFRRNSETTESGYFSIEHLPDLNVRKTDKRELKICLQAFKAEHWEPVIE